MNPLHDRQRTLIRLVLWAVLSSATILLVTRLASGLGSFATTETVGFVFLVVITLSAFFANLAVSVVVSCVATLCFDYFFLPPFGTLDIASVADWISLVVFLLIAVVISRLTASAAQTKANNLRMTDALRSLTALGPWLISAKNEELTLVAVAEELVRLFRFPYCSIHVYALGKWEHAVGSARTGIFEQVEGQVQKIDVPLDWTVMVAESEWGVRYVPIKRGVEAYAILAVKDDEATPDTLKLIASLVGARLAAT